MNTRDQKQYMQNLLSQWKTSQNKALKFDLFGEHRTLSYEVSHIYQAFFPHLFLLNLTFTFLLAKKPLSCSPLHCKPSALTACWTFPGDCLFAFQGNCTLQLPCLDSNRTALQRKHYSRWRQVLQYSVAKSHSYQESCVAKIITKSAASAILGETGTGWSFPQSWGFPTQHLLLHTSVFLAELLWCFWVYILYLYSVHFYWIERGIKRRSP